MSTKVHTELKPSLFERCKNVMLSCTIMNHLAYAYKYSKLAYTGGYLSEVEMINMGYILRMAENRILSKNRDVSGVTL